MDFIKKHIYDRLTILIASKQDSMKLGNTRFTFDEKIMDGTGNIINSVSRKRYFHNLKRENHFIYDDEISKLDWKTLIEITEIIKNNKFTFYKNIEGKDYRIRFKK